MGVFGGFAGIENQSAHPRAAKDILRGVLTLRGEISRMTWLFHDLAVPAGTKLHTDPGDAPPPATRA